MKSNRFFLASFQLLVVCLIHYADTKHFVKKIFDCGHSEPNNNIRLKAISPVHSSSSVQPVVHLNANSRNQFGHDNCTTALTETPPAAVFVVQSERKHAQLWELCVKPQILEGNAPVTE